MRAAAFLHGAIVALAIAAPAHSETLTLNYNLRASGLGAADVQVVVTLDPTTYKATAIGQTYGAADLFGSLTLSALSQGTLNAPYVGPTFFGTDNLYDGDQRRTRVLWNGHEAVAKEVLPSLADERRSAIPDDARTDTLDPISALMTFALGQPAQGVCAGAVKVFDGRRSYTLGLDNGDGGGALETRDIGGMKIDALRCGIVSVRTGGKSPDSFFSSSKPVERAVIWFWRDGKGRAIPIRVEADAPIGHAVAELAQLPQS